jgi:hypothetical protein
MFITKRTLSRRTFLRGAGTVAALPLLDAMIPPLAAQSGGPAPRLSFVYVPNGVILEQWTPMTVGAGFDLPPILAPLANVRNQLNILSGLAHREADSKGDGTGDHPRASAVWLTGVHAYDRTQPGVEVRLAKTVDQYAADRLGRETQLPSLEMTLEIPSAGACDSGDCFYVNTVSWRNATTPNLTEFHPRIVFERLFGDGGPASERAARLAARGSILDSVQSEIGRLTRSLGSGDRNKLDEYLDAVREVEQRIQNAEAAGTHSVELPDRPTDIPEAWDDHARLMFDLEVLAYQADVTRVTSMVMGRELSSLTFPQIGVPEGHHAISHHRGEADLISKKARIDIHHMELLTTFLDRMDAIQDGDGTLLDHSLILYGGGMGDGNLHGHADLPCLMAGSLGGRFRTGQHVAYPDDTPMSNLLLTILDKVGVELEFLGDSTGRITPDPLSVA